VFFYLNLVSSQKSFICNLIRSKILELKGILIFFVPYAKGQAYFFNQSDEKQAFYI